MIMSENKFLFKDREGSTTLSPTEKKGIKLKHIYLMKELDEAEALNIIHGLDYLRNYKKDDFLTIDFALKLHRNLFQDIWEWAGIFRLTEKNIGVGPFKVQIELHKTFEDVKFWINNNTFPPEEIGARFHHRLVWIHPFSNGNGRWARIYTEYLYKRLNWGKPNWHFGEEPHKRRQAYIKALQAADLKDMSLLIHFMKNV